MFAVALFYANGTERDPALRYAREGIELYLRTGQLGFLVNSYISVARVLTTFGELDEAQLITDKAQSLAARLSPWFEVCASAAQARLFLAQGNLRAALQWLQIHKLDADEQLKFNMMEFYIAYVRVLIVAGGSDNNSNYLVEAGNLLERLQAFSEKIGATGYVIETLVLQSMTLFNQSKIESALSRLKRALILAEPEGYVRLFVDEGEPTAQLLRHFASSGFMPEYVSKLLASFSSSYSGKMQSHSDPLSERELEVLRLIIAGLTNREIAEELFVSLGTIKTHINHIYQKIDVHSRTQAVARARELYLI